MKDYKRFTERVDSGFVSELDCRIAYNKLCAIEDKIEFGTLIELPCKVGDRIWVILGNNIFGRKVKSILIHESYTINTSDTSGWKELEPYYEKEFGIIWFTAKAEAEQKLKEQKK